MFPGRESASSEALFCRHSKRCGGDILVGMRDANFQANMRMADIALSIMPVAGNFLVKVMRCVGNRHLAAWAILPAAMQLAAAANAQENSRLAVLINEYRQSPQTCEGRRTRPVGPLAPDAALAQVRIGSGMQLQRALKQAGYQAAKAQGIAVSGPADPDSAMTAIRQRYCSILLDPQYTAIGVSRHATTWNVVLARPLLSGDLGNWQEAGNAILKLVNAARAEPRTCGRQKFSAAPPVAWNEKLASAAHAHSRDMASRNYFRHESKDGSQVDIRASQAGYRWRSIGENIATGQGSPEQAVSGWLASPGHCVNIMNRNFTEMGAAYAVNPNSDTTIYWTQVFGTPR